MRLIFILLFCIGSMSQTFTPNVQLQLPGTGQPGWATIVNNNFSKIDSAIGSLQNSFQGPWVSTFAYTRGQQVTFAGALYFSINSFNLNNQPDISPLSWSLVFRAATGTGTVTSVGLTVPGLIFQSPVAGSPVTGAGSLSLQLLTQTPNTFLAGPATGAGPLAPTFRAIVPADVPTLNQNTTGTAGSLAANGTNCAAGNYPLGVDAAGNAETCTAVPTRTSLGAAASGANGDITSLTGITTPLPVTEGGSGSGTAAGALVNFGAEATANKNAAGGYAGLDANKIIGGVGGAETPSALDSNFTITTINNCTTGCGNLWTKGFNTGGVQQFHAGQMIIVSSFGVFSDVATAPTLQIRLLVSGVVTLGTSTSTTPAVATNAPWECQMFMGVASVSGGNYNMEVNGWCVINGIDLHISNNATVPVPQATAGTFALVPIWGTAATGNTITIRSAFVRSWN